MIREKIDEPILGWRTRGNGFRNGRRTAMKDITEARANGLWTPDEHNRWLRQETSQFESLRGKPEYRLNRCYVAGRIAVLRSAQAQDYTPRALCYQCRADLQSKDPVSALFVLITFILLILLNVVFHVSALMILINFLIAPALLATGMHLLERQARKREQNDYSTSK